MFQIRSKIVEKVLGFFLVNKTARQYTNELARSLGVDPGNLDRKLKELVQEGILSSEFMGQQRYYFLNKNYPLLTELEKVFKINYGLENQLKEVLHDLPGLQAAYLFGSYAKGSLGEESDIDILLVGHHQVLEAERRILPLQRQWQREFNLIDMTRAEFKSKKAKKDELLQNIFQGKHVKII